MLYNEFRNIMADTGAIWIWSWLGYLCTSATLALGYAKTAKETKKGAEEGEGTEERSSGEAREVSESASQQERHGDKHAETARFSLSDKERRVLEQDKEIAQLHSRLLNYILEQFKSGEVDRLPYTNEILFGIGEGVRSKLLDATEIETIYMCKFDARGYIPEHSHMQEELIQVLKGSIKIELTDGAGNIRNSITMYKGDSFAIEPNAKHIISSSEGARTIMTFEPPIVKLDEDTDD